MRKYENPEIVIDLLTNVDIITSSDGTELPSIPEEDGTIEP